MNFCFKMVNSYLKKKNMRVIFSKSTCKNWTLCQMQIVNTEANYNIPMIYTIDIIQRHMFPHLSHKVFCLVHYVILTGK